MFGFKKKKLNSEKKLNEEKLKKLHGREVRYASKRDSVTYVEKVIGKNGVIQVIDDIFSIVCNDKVIFKSPINDLWGSDLMSLDGIILTPGAEKPDTDNEIMVYYKYYRKVDN